MNSEFTLSSENINTLRSIIFSAGDILLDHYNSPRDIETKIDNTLVSRADRDSSKYISEQLKNHFPSYSIIDEESSNENMTSTYCWVIDPLDGTREYLKKGTNFGIIIGLLKDNTSIFGITYRPFTRELIYAARGKGACREIDGRKENIFVSKKPEINLIISESRISPEFENILKKLNVSTIDRMGSSFKIIDVAQGKASLFIQPPNNTMHLWDLCGTSCILEEAGGKITDWHGNPLSFSRSEFDYNNGLIISNTKIHSDIVERLQNL